MARLVIVCCLRDLSLRIPDQLLGGEFQHPEGCWISVTEIGRIATTYTWAFAVFQLFSGALLDRLGSRLIIPPAIALVTLGISMFANASAYQTFLAAQVVLALGACGGFVGAGYIGGQWFGMAKFSFMSA